MASAHQEIEAPATIACIGLGAMGLPVARCLVRRGYRVVGYDASSDARDSLRRQGGEVAATAADAMQSAAAVLTLLPNGAVVQAVLLDDACTKALGQARPLLIEMSSSAPADTIRLGERLVGLGTRVIDAPVSGGVSRAETGSLAIMAGGDPRDLEAARPILSALGTQIVHTGPLGSGHAMKALNNYLSAIGLAAASEALLVGREFGLQPDVMLQVLNQSSGRNSSTENKIAQFVLSGDYNSGFSLALMAKDVGIADELASSAGRHAPLSRACSQLWKQAASEMPGVDHTAIFRYLENKTPPRT